MYPSETRKTTSFDHMAYSTANQSFVTSYEESEGPTLEVVGQGEHESNPTNVNPTLPIFIQRSTQPRRTEHERFRSISLGCRQYRVDVDSGEILNEIDVSRRSQLRLMSSRDLMRPPEPVRVRLSCGR